METSIITVPVAKLVSSTDRKYGGEGNIETLAQSIKEIGIIHPMAVKEIADKKGYYRVIAGRRRYEAVKSLGWKIVDVKLYEDDANEESIALAENVNRDDMHPLDEAETFRRQLDRGMDVEEIAKYYSRSISGIYQRIRLTNLIDSVKVMFRDGKINLSGAALIASLPEEDQGKFVKKYGDKTVDKWELCNFMRAIQKMVIRHVIDDQCRGCKKRTYNTVPGLFDEYSSLEDVCFNSECYAQKWHALIGRLIAEQAGETENYIILNRGLPEFIPRKSKTMKIGEKEYSLLPHNSYSWKETNKKSKAKTAWVVSLDWHMSSGAYDVKVSRVTYEKSERQSYSSSYTPTPVDPIKKFMIDLLPEIKPEEQKSIADMMEKKHPYPWNFFSDIRETLLAMIVSKRLKEESKENVAAVYMMSKFSGNDKEGNWHEIDPEYQGLFETIFGKGFSLDKIPRDPMIEKIFKFIIALSIDNRNMPELNDSEDKWARSEESLFWKFAQITKEEYCGMYRELLTTAIREEIGKGDKPADEPEDNAPDISMDDSAGDE